MRDRAGRQGTRGSNSELARGGSKREPDSAADPVRHRRVVGRVWQRVGSVGRHQARAGSARVGVLAGSGRRGSCRHAAAGCDRRVRAARSACPTVARRESGGRSAELRHACRHRAMGVLASSVARRARDREPVGPRPRRDMARTLDRGKHTRDRGPGSRRRGGPDAAARPRAALGADGLWDRRRAIKRE